MIRSMTGYGRAEAPGERAGVLVECKSVNHRHLAVSLKLPRALSSLELDARRLVQSRVQRGRVDVAATLLPGEAGLSSSLVLDLAQAREYAEIARRLADETQLAGGATVA